MNTPQKKKYYQHPEFKHVYGDQVVTPIGRLVYPSLIVPKKFKGKDGGEKQNSAPRYEGTILLAKDGGAQLQAFIDQVDAMTTEMLEIFNKGRSMKFSDLEILKDGDIQYEKDPEKYDFYKGMWVIPARNAKKPETIDKTGDIDASIFEGGMKVKGLLTPMITAHGVSYRLDTLKYIGDDGQRFGGGIRDNSHLLNEGDEDEAEEAVKRDQTLAAATSEEEGEVAPKEKKGKKSRADELASAL